MDTYLEVNPEVERAANPQKGTNYSETDTKAVWKNAILLVQEINKLKQKKKEINVNKLKSKFGFLNQNYPSIFNMLTNASGSYENMGTRMKRLKEMLDKINEVQTGRKTIDDAHTEIGNKYAKEFMPADLMKPPE